MSEVLNVYDFTKRTTEEVFPYITVLEPNNTLPLIVGILTEGDMPLVVEMKGKRKVVARIDKSAYNIDKLLRTNGSLNYHKSSDDVLLIENIKEYMEVFQWT